MYLKKKIILSFFLRSAILIVLVIAGYINFVDVRKEIRYLELSDTIRSKSLQLRRHEKNLFLYGDPKEVENVHDYLRELNTILRSSGYTNNEGELLSLKNKIEEYEKGFNRIEIISRECQKEFSRLKSSYPKYLNFFPLIESTFLERSLINAELLERIFLLRSDTEIINGLRELNAEINTLRKNGEDIISISKDLDKSAREKVERAISLTQTAGLILFPLFFVVGLGALYGISHSIVNRLRILTHEIEKTGKGDFLSLPTPQKKDEIGMLIDAFNRMKQDLIKRDEELNKMNEELLLSRKLASLGTLAAGVAHELNNPLNNIYIAAQILSKEIDSETSPKIVKETVKDIFSQTLRVKRIVSELLEFAREKPPEFKKINLAGVIKDVLGQMMVCEMANVECDLQGPEEVEISADRYLMEQVFINLLSNAIDAMDGKGLLDIKLGVVDSSVQIKISDTGKGISSKDFSRIFDPFFTTKEKGTGLGLAIVYSIITKHKGKIEFQTELNKGTTFIVTLPREV